MAELDADLRRTLRLRWVMLAVPAGMYFVSYFHRVAPAVVATDLMRAFAITAQSLGSLSAVYPYVFVVMGLVGGSLVDTLGPRRTLALGAACMGTGAIVFGFAPVFGVAWVGRLVIGLGASVVLISFLGLTAAWFRPGEFATIGGWTQTVGNLGALVASAPLAVLVDAIGWRSSFVMIGVATALLAVAALLVIRDRPEAMGLPSLTPGPSRPRATSAGEVLRSIPAVLANPRSWPPALAAGGMFGGLITLQGLWGVPYLTQVYGLPRSDAAGIASYFAVGMMVGGPVPGWVSDRWLSSRRVPYVVFAAVFAACWLPFAVSALRVPALFLRALVFVMGFSATGFVLSWSCVREVNDPARVGIAIGFCNLPIFLTFALLQWVTGVILDARWEGAIEGGVRVYPPAAWEAAFTVCLVVAVGTLVMTTLVTETRCRNVWQPRQASRGE